MAGSETPEFHERLRAVEEALRRLDARVADLSREPGPTAAGAAQAEPASGDRPRAAGDGAIGSRLGRFLAGATILCLVLVVALVLRMFADDRWVTARAGAALGIAYCGALIVAAALAIGRDRMIGSILAVSSELLCLLVVVENYHRYHALGFTTALGALGGLAVSSTILGVRAGSRTIAAIVLLGSALVAVVLDLPNAPLRALGIWLVAAGALTLRLSRLAGWGGLRWPVFLLTLGAAGGWAAFLQVEGGAAARLASFAPVLAAIGLLYVGDAIARAGRPGAALDAFTAAAPLFGSAGPLALGQWAFGASAVAPAGLGVSAALLAIGSWHSLRAVPRPRASGALLTAGAVLAVWWIHAAVPSVTLRAAVVSIGALLLFDLSRRSGSRTPRLLAHLVQAAQVFLLVGTGAFAVSAPAGISIAASAVVAAAAAGQYAWSRVVPAPSAGVLGTVDPNDRLAVIALLAGASAAFCAVRAAGFAALGVAADASAVGAFQAFQSVAICALVAIALVAAVRFRLPDVLAVALGVLALVGAKVVLYDVFTLAGVRAIAAVLVLAATTGGASWAVRRRRR